MSSDENSPPPDPAPAPPPTPAPTPPPTPVPDPVPSAVGRWVRWKTIAAVAAAVAAALAAFTQFVGLSLVQVIALVAGWFSADASTQTQSSVSPAVTAAVTPVGASPGPAATTPATPTQQPILQPTGQPTQQPAPQPTQQPTVQPTPQPRPAPTKVAVVFDQRGTVAQCDVLTGRGDQPATGKVVIFVRYATNLPWYYEQPIEFRGDHTWIARRVQTGVDADTGKDFIYAAVAVDDQKAADLKATDGTPYTVDVLPGTKLDTTGNVTRNGVGGACA